MRQRKIQGQTMLAQMAQAPEGLPAQALIPALDS